MKKENPFAAILFVLGDSFTMPLDLVEATERLLRGAGKGDDLFAVAEHLSLQGFNREKLIRDYELWRIRHRQKGTRDIALEYVNRMERANICLGLKRACNKQRSSLARAIKHFGDMDATWKMVCHVKWGDIKGLAFDIREEIFAWRKEARSFLAFLSNVTKAQTEDEMRRLINERLSSLREPIIEEPAPEPDIPYEVDDWDMEYIVD